MLSRLARPLAALSVVLLTGCSGPSGINGHAIGGGGSPRAALDRQQDRYVAAFALLARQRDRRSFCNPTLCRASDAVCQRVAQVHASGRSVAVTAFAVEHAADYLRGLVAVPAEPYEGELIFDDATDELTFEVPAGGLRPSQLHVDAVLRSDDTILFRSSAIDTRPEVRVHEISHWIQIGGRRYHDRDQIDGRRARDFFDDVAACTEGFASAHFNAAYVADPTFASAGFLTMPRDFETTEINALHVDASARTWFAGALRPRFSPDDLGGLVVAATDEGRPLGEANGLDFGSLYTTPWKNDSSNGCAVPFAGCNYVVPRDFPASPSANHFLERFVQLSDEAGGATVLSGSVCSANTSCFFMLRKLGADHLPDAAFGANGRGSVAIDFPNTGRALASGHVRIGDRYYVIGRYVRGNNPDNVDLAIARLRLDGTLDSDYGSNGRVVHSIGNEVQVGRPAADGAGGVLVPLSVRVTGRWRPALLRLDANGDRDTHFGSDSAFPGMAWIGSGTTTAGQTATNAATRVVALADGKSLVSGRLVAGTWSFWIARLGADGAADATFGSAGIVTVELPAGSLPGMIYATPLADGRYLATSNVKIPTTGKGGLAIARFDAVGKLDISVDTTGLQLFRHPDALDLDADDVLLQPDGRLLIAGTQRGPQGTSGFAARLTAEPGLLVRWAYSQIPTLR